MSQAHWEGPLDGFVRVEVFDSRAHAEVARTALAVRGIPSTLLADDDGGVGGISLSLDHQAAELRVPQDRWAEARESLGLSSAPVTPPRTIPLRVMIAAMVLIVAVAVPIALSVVN